MTTTATVFIAATIIGFAYIVKVYRKHLVYSKSFEFSTEDDAAIQENFNRNF
jgi:hypothetical protein